MARNLFKESMLFSESVYDKCWNTRDSVRLWYNHSGRRYDYLSDKFDFSQLQYSRIATDCEKLKNHCGVYGVDEVVPVDGNLDNIDFTVVKNVTSIIYSPNYGYYLMQDFSRLGIYVGYNQYVLYDHRQDRVYIIYFKHI